MFQEENRIKNGEIYNKDVIENLQLQRVVIQNLCLTK